MDTFKAICKASGNNWETTYPKKIVKKLFGLIKHIEKRYVPGPVKDEVCVVTDEYVGHDKSKYYVLSGYPYGGYNSKYFVRMDEFTETQKEIAEKSAPVFN